MPVGVNGLQTQTKFFFVHLFELNVQIVVCIRYILKTAAIDLNFELWFLYIIGVTEAYCSTEVKRRNL